MVGVARERRITGPLGLPVFNDQAPWTVLVAMAKSRACADRGLHDMFCSCQQYRGCVTASAQKSGQTFTGSWPSPQTHKSGLDGGRTRPALGGFKPGLESSQLVDAH